MGRRERHVLVVAGKNICLNSKPATKFKLHRPTDRPLNVDDYLKLSSFFLKKFISIFVFLCLSTVGY